MKTFIGTVVLAMIMMFGCGGTGPGSNGANPPVIKNFTITPSTISSSMTATLQFSSEDVGAQITAAVLSNECTNEVKEFPLTSMAITVVHPAGDNNTAVGEVTMVFPPLSPLVTSLASGGTCTTTVFATDNALRSTNTLTAVTHSQVD
jgi:Cu/Ag efflux protein CusF